MARPRQAAFSRAFSDLPRRNCPLFPTPHSSDYRRYRPHISCARESENREQLSEDDAMTQVMDRKSTEKTSTARVRLLDLGNVSAEWGVDRLIERSIELRASDLFLVTNEQHVSVQVRLRG